MSEELKQKLAQKYNPKSNKEGLILVQQSIDSSNNKTPIEKILSAASDEFTKETGRNMTYSEMRQMFG